MEKNKSQGTSRNARNDIFGTVPRLRNAGGYNFNHLERGRFPLPIEGKHDDGPYKLAGDVSGSKFKSIERGRLTTNIRSKNEIDKLERRRKGTDAPVTIKTTDSLDKTARKHTTPRKNSVSMDLTQSERRRSEFQQNAITTDKAIAEKTAKTARGVTSLGKLRTNMAQQEEPSNKRVVDTPSLPNSTDSAQYDPHTNYNTNLAASSDSSQADQLPQPCPPPLCAPSAQYQTDREETGLTLPTDIPFLLSQKSCPHPVASSAFCDRVSITFNVPMSDLNEIVSKVNDLVTAMKSGPYALHRIFTGETLYEYSYKLVDAAGYQKLFLQFQPKNTKTRFCRMEFNSREIGQDGIYQIKLIMKGLFGPSYRDYLAEGNFTRLDATLDVDKLKPDDVIMVSNRARNSSLWQKSYNLKGHEMWSTKTTCLGSLKSGFSATIYDKAAQLWEVKGERLTELRTRIEVRINPRGKNRRSIAVKDILQIKNPFAVISIAYYPAPDDDDPWFEFFVCASRHFGQEEALRKIKDRNKRARYRHKLLENEPDWWQPEKLWAEFLADLRSTGLFPDKIFGITK